MSVFKYRGFPVNVNDKCCEIGIVPACGVPAIMNSCSSFNFLLAKLRYIRKNEILAGSSKGSKLRHLSAHLCHMQTYVTLSYFLFCNTVQHCPGQVERTTRTRPRQC